MWPAIKNGFVKFFTDEAYFASKWDKWVAKVRGTLLGGGIALTTYADQLGPEWGPRARFTGVCLSAFSLMLRAGDKTPAEVKQLAVDLKGQP